jgi:hypothetical protein
MDAVETRDVLGAMFELKSETKQLSNQAHMKVGNKSY